MPDGYRVVDVKLAQFRLALRALELYVIEIVLLVLVFLNAANVLSRYVLHRSIGASFELMILFAIGIYWIGIGTAERYSGHLGMNFVVARLPAKLQRVTAELRRIVICGFLIATAIAGMQLTRSQFESGAVSGTLALPLWIFAACISFGTLLMLVRIVRPPPKSAVPDGATPLL